LTVGGALAALFLFTGALIRRLHLVAVMARAAGRIPGARRRADLLAASCRTWSSEVSASIGSRQNRMRLLACALGATVADGTCFVFALRAAGVHRGWVVLTLAYAVGMLAAFVPLLPAGLGAVEAAVPAFLAYAHVPVPVALGGILAYRALGTLMPAFVGGAALAQLRLRRRRRTQTPGLALKWFGRWRWSRPQPLR
jgi:putative heme transporter